VKIFSQYDIPAIATLALISLFIGLFLNNMPRSLYSESVQQCDTFSAQPDCRSITTSVQKYGWPFVTRVHYSNPVLEDKTSVDINSYLVFLILICIYIIYRRYGSSLSDTNIDGTTNAQDSSIISSANLLEDTALVSLDKSTMSGYQYNLLSNKSNRVMLLITLHHNTNLHLVAVGDKSDAGLSLTQKIKNKFLEPVKLEGDFPDYFKLYCSTDKQIELRELLDPTAMALLVDFCQAYDLEIFNDTLYISQAANAKDKNDQTDLVTDTETFVQKYGHVLDGLGMNA
jgi:hypothetical protein